MALSRPRGGPDRGRHVAEGYGLAVEAVLHRHHQRPVPFRVWADADATARP